MEGEDVSDFALTYRRIMTRELGHLKIEGYEYWEMFHMQCTTLFALTHEGERALAAMEKMKYTGNFDKFMLEFENHNTYVGLSGVAMRQMGGRTMPREAMRRLSTLEYPLDTDWMAVLRECTRREDIFLEEQSWRHDQGGRSTNGKRKREDKAVTKPRKRRRYIPLKKRPHIRRRRTIRGEERALHQAIKKWSIWTGPWRIKTLRTQSFRNEKNAKQCMQVDLTATDGKNVTGPSKCRL